ncbi:MAG: hypothetical protein HDR18_15575 [Lachnospiraceae bacterium]|nr:hypothetical protein [Lachnospiraceae bacterium]
MQTNPVKQNIKSFIAVFAAGMMSIFVFNIVKLWAPLRERVGGTNLAQYALVCCVFMITYLAAYAILQCRIFDREKVLNMLSGICCVSVVPFMYIFWRFDTKVAYSSADTFLWHMYPTVIVLGILIAIALLYGTIATHLKMEERKEKCCFGLYYALIIASSGFLNHFPEYLSVDYYHGSAVFNSIYNVMQGVPYGEITNSVYGNYAILLALPLKLFGKGEYIALSGIMSLLTMLCVGMCIYAIHNLIERKDIRVLCTAALLWNLVFLKRNYWQRYPMRVLWPTVLIAWMVFLNRHVNHAASRRYKYYAGTWLILVLSIVWNKESGIVCLIGYLVYTVSRGIVGVYAKENIRMRDIVCECFVMITSLPAAYMAVGLYNLAVSGTWITWQVFLFPLFSKKYMIGSLELSLWPGIWTWMAVVILFLGMVVRLGIRILRRELYDSKTCIYAAVAVIGLGLMTYFMNRAAYGNLTICYYEAIICMGGLFELMKQDDYGRMVSTTMRTLQALVLIALIIGEILHFGDALYTRTGYENWEILALRDQIREDVQEDTYAFGIDIPELYSILGWKTRSYTTDWADASITGDAIPNKLYSDLEYEDTIITSQKTLERRKEVAEYVYDRYRIEKTYTLNENVEFYLMKRK